MLVKLLGRFITAFVPNKAIRNRIRHRISIGMYTAAMRKLALSVGGGSVAVGETMVSHETVVGKFSAVSNGFTVLGHGRVTIGDLVSIGPNCVIQTQNHDYEGEYIPYGKEFILKPVAIDDCVWIGMNVQILPGTHIGEGAIIQMGSVVHGEIPPYAIAGGNPAKVFAWRDKNHYDELKELGLYTTMR